VAHPFAVFAKGAVFEFSLYAIQTIELRNCLRLVSSVLRKRGLCPLAIPYESAPGPPGDPHSFHSFSQFQSSEVTLFGNLNPS